MSIRDLNHPFPKFLFDTKVPNILYHYTSSSGLMGIIKNNNIWATKTTYLNDSSEIKLALDFIREEIKVQKRKNDKEKYIFGYEDMLSALDGIENVNVSVVSFSTYGDQLSQWRGYSKVGDGYSLGFNGETLKTQVESQGNNYGEKCYLLPCQYDPSVHKMMIMDLINYSLVRNDLGYSLSKQEEEFEYSNSFHSFEKNVLIVSQIIKSSSFIEEDEWRLISPSMDLEKIKFRVGRHSLIPYWEIYLDIINTLKSVTIGPTPEPNLSYLALRSFLLTQNHLSPDLFANHNLLTEKLIINNSKIPYRMI
jgi:hypothetical protein